MGVKVEFDPNKSARNERERGLPFDGVLELDWERAFAFVDHRMDYGEKRLIAFVPLQERLHVVCYVDRGDTRRIISFRKANKREENIYAKATAHR